LTYASIELIRDFQWNETENPLFGLTTNPRNAAFTPGGSTGGEGALLASQGSIIGWGTDIGGSVRIPAAHNGVYALRPSVSGFLLFDFNAIFNILTYKRVVDFLTLESPFPQKAKSMFIL
jgi:hypothetical protein